MGLKNNRGPLTKWFGSFGFIRFEDRDVFVHADNYLPGFFPQLGQVVLFDFGLAPDKNKPPMAVNVRVWKSAKVVAAENEIRRGLEALAQSQGGGQ